MNNLKFQIRFSIFTVLTVALMLPVNAVGGHKSCRIKAVNDDVYVRLFDVDRAGNTIRQPGYFISGELWKGRLKEGESKEIKSTYGRIRYSYKSESDFRTYGEILAQCFHGETIRLP